jgi:hypothetical protein
MISNFTPAGLLAPELLGEELVTLGLAHANRAEQTRQRVNANHLHDLALLGERHRHACQHDANGHSLHRKFHRVSPWFWTTD